MYFIGLDPSFVGFGVATINMVRREINTKKFAEDISKKRFDYISQAAIKLANTVDEEFQLREITRGVMETPPPNSQFSAGLWALDCMVASKCTDKMRFITPNYLGFIHGVRKWKKSQSVQLAKEIIEIFKTEGFDTEGFRAESNQCEAFLMCVRAMISYRDFAVDNSITIPFELDHISTKICNKYPKYTERKEFNLSY